jgi:hypothetical protein
VDNIIKWPISQLPVSVKERIEYLVYKSYFIWKRKGVILWRRYIDSWPVEYKNRGVLMHVMLVLEDLQDRWGHLPSFNSVKIKGEK